MRIKWIEELAKSGETFAFEDLVKIFKLPRNLPDFEKVFEEVLRRIRDDLR